MNASETTFGIPPSDADWYYCAVIEWASNGETDYLDGYASGPRPTRTGLREHTACRHSWVGGMMHVHDEDLESVAASGRKIECERCDQVYGKPEKPLFKILEWEVKPTPHGAHAQKSKS